MGRGPRPDQPRLEPAGQAWRTAGADGPTLAGTAVTRKFLVADSTVFVTNYRRPRDRAMSADGSEDDGPPVDSRAALP